MESLRTRAAEKAGQDQRGDVAQGDQGRSAGKFDFEKLRAANREAVSKREQESGKGQESER
ncbi:hypothetical protein VB151_12725 [Xanthomonas fragariae]|uniref:Uncharacterized protein n=2 Tax=Xanthomonas fragariae TaxID=48664 RepID=A0A1Y6HDR7_9XANT|nr:hypothetical protein [Xanthomonas fragariae]MBL9198790.1 hypothetical protein [Xanthomonas fragariae]MBL9223134.1 hypothetical protein [Xanthomonas fragariae]MDM7555392.1 hypothetical protein [Xanthomonas fragariae]MDM7558527.1 hypothetical protein [Xanthomonas fragariae]MDM7573121.1 hypothetical protein [Xanthomonas fragariae]